MTNNMLGELPEHDFFVVQVAFRGPTLEITYVEEATTTDTAAIVSTLQIDLGEDPDLLAYTDQVQEILNMIIVRGYQKIRDEKRSEVTVQHPLRGEGA